METDSFVEKNILAFEIESRFANLDHFEDFKSFAEKLCNHLKNLSPTILDKASLGPTVSRILKHLFLRFPSQAHIFFPLLQISLEKRMISPHNLELILNSVSESQSRNLVEKNDMRKNYDSFLKEQGPLKSKNNPFSRKAVDNSSDIDFEPFISNLQSIFETDFKKAACKITNYSFSLLDLDGTFLFGCPNTRKLFGIKGHSKKKNFCDLLVPFSVFSLKTKFPEGIFNFSTTLEQRKKIEYVIFSKKAQKKFFLLKEKIDNRTKTRLLGNMSNEDIYWFLLESLTSTIEPVQLLVTDEDMNNVKTPDLSMQDLPRMRKMISKEKIINSFLLDKKCQKETTETDQQITSKKKNQNLIRKTSSNFDSKKQIKSWTIPAILMKTRLRDKMISYPYELLQNHPKVIRFKSVLKESMKNAHPFS